jgi:hypothetical protein
MKTTAYHTHLITLEGACDRHSLAVNVIHTTVTHNYQEEEEEEYMLVHCGLSVYSLKKSQMNFLEGRRARVSSGCTEAIWPDTYMKAT